MKRSVFSGLMVLAVLALLAGCGGSDDAVMGNNGDQLASVTTDRGPLRVTLTADRSTYEPGQDVQLVLEVENTSSADVTLTFNSTRVHDFEVFGGSTLIWSYSFGRVYGTTITHVTLQPGEVFRRNATWNRTDNAGKPVAPQVVRVRGLLPEQHGAIYSDDLHLTLK